MLLRFEFLDVWIAEKAFIDIEKSFPLQHRWKRSKHIEISGYVNNVLYIDNFLYVVVHLSRSGRGQHTTTAVRRWITEWVVGMS